MTAKGRRTFGSVRKLPSKRWQARYTGPDGRTYPATRNGQPLTFDTRRDAETWLAERQTEIHHDQWKAPAATKPAELEAPTLREYSTSWLAMRPLAVRTKDHYAALLANHVYSTFGDTLLAHIDTRSVRKWHAGLATKTGPTAQAHAYALLRTILNTAVDDEWITVNPCRIRGAGQAKRQSPESVPATPEQLATLVAAMPPRHHLLVLFAGFCAPRFGELTELRRKDVNVATEELSISRAVVKTRGNGRLVKKTKSERSRVVVIPPHLMPAVEAHLRDFAAPGPNGLLFPAVLSGGHLSESTVRKQFRKAKLVAGRPDFRFHDLRHTAGTWASQLGASLKEVMAYLGHTTVSAAMRYQHADPERRQWLAGKLSEERAATVTPIEAAPSAAKKPRRRSA
jgi:integrase